MTHNNYKLRKVGLISIFQRKTLPFSHSSTFRVSLSIFFFFFFWWNKITLFKRKLQECSCLKNISNNITLYEIFHWLINSGIYECKYRYICIDIYSTRILFSWLINSDIYECKYRYICIDIYNTRILFSFLS